MKITRTLIFSVVFLIAGGLLLIAAMQRSNESVPYRITTVPEQVVPIVAFEPLGVTTSILRFPNENESLSFNLEVPTVSYSLIVAVLFVGVGAYGLAPIRTERAERTKTSGLILAGVLIIPTVLILAAAGQSTNMISMLGASFRLGTPIIIGAMAGIWCERSGVVNIAIEGMMLTGAAFGFVAYTFVTAAVPGQGGLWLGIAAAVASGGLMALLHAWLSVTFKTDQIISGTVINIMALGLTAFMRREVILNADASFETLSEFSIPVLSEIPVVGEVLFTGKPIFFSMFLLVILTHVMLYYTRWGLRTRAVGENPHAADTLGINVQRNRYINVVIGGLIAGLAGAWFSLETAGGFRDGMTSGTGFIALAAMIFGKWTPFGAAAGGLLFGFSQALDTRFQLLNVPIPVQFVQMTPYIVTMIVLAGLVGRATAPKAVGQPYEKE